MLNVQLKNKTALMRSMQEKSDSIEKIMNKPGIAFF